MPRSPDRHPARLPLAASLPAASLLVLAAAGCPSTTAPPAESLALVAADDLSGGGHGSATFRLVARGAIELRIEAVLVEGTTARVVRHADRHLRRPDPGDDPIGEWSSDYTLLFLDPPGGSNDGPQLRIVKADLAPPWADADGGPLDTLTAAGGRTAGDRDDAEPSWGTGNMSGENSFSFSGGGGFSPGGSSGSGGSGDGLPAGTVVTGYRRRPGEPDRPLAPFLPHVLSVVRIAPPPGFPKNNYSETPDEMRARWDANQKIADRIKVAVAALPLAPADLVAANRAAEGEEAESAVYLILRWAPVPPPKTPGGMSPRVFQPFVVAGADDPNRHPPRRRTPAPPTPAPRSPLEAPRP